MAGLNALRPQVLYRIPDQDGFVLDSATDGVLGTDSFGPTNDHYDIITSAEITAMTIRRGRKHMLDQMAPGTAAVTLENTDGTIDVSDLAIGQAITIRALDTAASPTTVFQGILESADPVTDPLRGTTMLILRAVDGLRQLTDIRPAPGGAPAESVNSRMLRILSYLPEDSPWPTNIDAASTSLQASDFTGNLLAEIQACELADGGVLFHSLAGTYRYISKANLYAASRYTTPVVTVTDTAAGLTANPVDVIDRSKSAERIINQVRLLRQGQTVPQQGVNGESVTLHGRRVKALNVLNTNAPTTLAQTYADTWSTGDQPYQAMKVHAGRGDWENDLPGLELQDPIEVGASGVDTVLEGISHNWTPAAGWTATLNVNYAIPANAT